MNLSLRDKYGDKNFVVSLGSCMVFEKYVLVLAVGEEHGVI